MNKEEQWLLDEKYQGQATGSFLEDCARLAAGEPLAYLIGHVPFLNCTIHLDSHPLIPRPETEYWTQLAIKTIQQTSSPRAVIGRPLQILDLCAGSGAIGVAVAQALPDATITFTELDPTHLSTITKNISENTVIHDSENYCVIESDLCEKLDKNQKYDFILTNPPYIDKEANTVDASVTAHEPHLALFGGTAGMEIIARIITEAGAYLTPDGQLWIEHEPFQSGAIDILAREQSYACSTHPDQYGTLRYSILASAMAQ